MAIYHLSAQVIGRSSGRSATGAAAYRAGELIRDERTGLVFDYRRKGGVEYREIMLPANAPEWMCNREQLWNAVEKAEARKDAQLSREVEISLPRELPPAARLELLRAFVQREFVERGMVADVCVHNKRDAAGQECPHAHVMLTMRDLIGQGFGKKNRDWNGKDHLEEWRERWAEHVNRALGRAGRAERVDHRTLEAQRANALERAADLSRSEAERAEAARQAEDLDREPQPKVGARAAALERWGITSERGDQWRRVQERNAERGRLRRALREVREQAARLVARGSDALKARVDVLLGRATLATPHGPAREPTLQDIAQPQPQLHATRPESAREVRPPLSWERIHALLGRVATARPSEPVAREVDPPEPMAKPDERTPGWPVSPQRGHGISLDRVAVIAVGRADWFAIRHVLERMGAELGEKVRGASYDQMHDAAVKACETPQQWTAIREVLQQARSDVLLGRGGEFGSASRTDPGRDRER